MIQLLGAACTQHGNIYILWVMSHLCLSWTSGRGNWQWHVIQWWRIEFVCVCFWVSGSRTKLYYALCGFMFPAQSSASSTSGYSESLGDCLCPDGSALVERNRDGTYLEAKKCVKCSEGVPSSRHHLITKFQGWRWSELMAKCVQLASKIWSWQLRPCLFEFWIMQLKDDSL